jgi:hypothetical protein
VSGGKLVDPYLEARELLAMPTRKAEALFQSYATDRQLEIIASVHDPKAREALYYLVPDCTELIQRSPTEDVLQILDTMLGTGLASALLPCLSTEQFEEIMDIVLWRNGKLDEQSLDLWLVELSQCEPEELSQLLSRIDAGILANLVRDRVEIDSEFRALFIEEGLLDPSTPGIEYADERTRAIMDAIWLADADLFTRVLYELFGLDSEEPIDAELDASLERAKDARDYRVRQRDRASGIELTEEEVLQKVDLEDLELEDDPFEDTEEDV